MKLPPLLALTLLLSACGLAPLSPPAPPSPKKGVSERPSGQMAATAHPLASQAALAILEQGGSPIDAAIAAQMVLGLVEPQSSGLGGGLYVLHYDAATKALTAFDGLAAAPATATASLRTDTDGRTLPSEPSQRGGRTVGVPGTLSALTAVHGRYGRLPWPALLAPAIRLAEDGYPMAPYLHGILSLPDAAKNHPDLRSAFFREDGTPHPVGTTLRNPAYAATLRRIATEGPQGYLARGGAKAIVEAAARGYRPTLMREADVLGYRAEEREPACAPFLAYRVCAAGPASFGGIYVLQVLQMVEARAGGRFDFSDPAFVHLYAEAGKLAQADRRRFVGDPAFASVPVAALVSPAYARTRAAGIDANVANPNPAPGAPATALATLDADPGDPFSATSQVAIADAAGNAISVTTTINLNFGSRLVADGYVLNNALTNFSPAPAPGQRFANQMAPGKRPVTSMAPTIVFDTGGRPVVVGGSAGGGPIVDYIASSLIEMLANGRTPGEALAAGHVTTAVPGKVQVEAGTSAAALAPALAAKGHAVEAVPLLSGLGFLKRTEAGWIGAADPRRDGAALGSR